ncbi:FeoA family protein [Clostridium septicum]|uniref:Ferrous iron transport protein A n=1 Tax=Clostridium septicum TaxID=1504 RepID=A0A9N7PJ49_CLOSE|nr:FeoA family protein [Clostridium septicum]AYE34376.1 ferrous iron transport protein A [Clostridium septicum]MDU1312562.1 FeoA family protein [Clostridium septicum]QAS59782.1 ferrous iron transport protein A [Clostridium septicum]UEC20982.1 ferrous iron transport protein A [Clostridium septicum]USS00969.1 ferrous iron transport protein A [Clostridium septicum]
MEYKNTLNKIDSSDYVEVVNLDVNGDMRRRFLDLGIINGTKIKILYRSPLGDPRAYLIRGAVIAIRDDEAKHIYVQSLKKEMN